MKNNFKTALKAIALLLIILFFVPSFAVSCSGQTFNVSAFSAMGGYESDTLGQVSDPQPILIVLLLLPIAMGVIMFLKQLVNEEKKQSLVMLILGVVDLIGWIIFRSKVISFCAENMCDVSTKFSYVLNVLGTLAVALIGAGIYFGFITDEGIHIGSISVNGGAGTGAAAAVGPTKKCKFCGAANITANKFCTSCGQQFAPETVVEAPVETPVAPVETPVAPAEAAQAPVENVAPVQEAVAESVAPVEEKVETAVEETSQEATEAVESAEEASSQVTDAAETVAEKKEEE